MVPFFYFIGMYKLGLSAEVICIYIHIYTDVQTPKSIIRLAFWLTN